jgi:hypothetical protein
VIIVGETPYDSTKAFEELNLLPKLLKGIYSKMGFEKPSKIQKTILPMILTHLCRNDNAFQFHHVGFQTLVIYVANRTSSYYQVCIFYQQGCCKYGESYLFHHVQNLEIEESGEDKHELDLLQLTKNQ